MARIFASHTPFLQNSAQLLVLPVSSDGIAKNSTLIKTMGLYPSNFDAYKSLAETGEAVLGDVLLHTVQKQVTGLGIATNKSADYIANLITTHHAHHDTQKSTVITAFKQLNPKLFELMRYRGLKTVAIFATPMMGHAVTPQFLWQAIHETLDLSRIIIEVHFSRLVDLTNLSAKTDI